MCGGARMAGTAPAPTLAQGTVPVLQALGPGTWQGELSPWDGGSGVPLDEGWPFSEHHHPGIQPFLGKCLHYCRGTGFLSQSPEELPGPMGNVSPTPDTSALADLSLSA